MKKLLLMAAFFATSLAACGRSPPTDQAAKPDSMSSMAMASETKQANGVGTITSIDSASGKITLDHGPVVELQWPAMKMTFAGNAASEHGLAVGDRVAFSFRWDGKAGQLTSIHKQ